MADFYRRIAARYRTPSNKETLRQIARDYFNKEIIDSIPKPGPSNVPRTGTGINYEPEKLSYHEGLGYVVPGVTRSVCYTSELGYGTAILRIRTTDHEPDAGLVRRLQESGLRVSMSQEIGVSIHYPGISVKLEEEGKNSYYEIMTMTVPREKISEAMDNLDLIGKVFLQAKEMPYCRGLDSDDLAAALKMRKFPIAMEGFDAVRAKAGAAIRGLAQKYMANPTLLQGPLVQFLEVGDLADIAYGYKSLQDELRAKVRDIIGWQMMQNAGKMTAMDYLPIFERICGAFGITTPAHPQC